MKATMLAPVREDRRVAARPEGSRSERLALPEHRLPLPENRLPE